MKGFPTLLLVVSILLFSSCFHKNVETDNADDIVANLIYDGPEGQFILSKEKIFQANSKSSEGGVTTISGYAEFRLTSYKIASGEIAGRVALGEQIEEANNLLGYSPGKVWMFSIDPELGLHYRDPVKLEVKETWKELSQKPGLASFRPAHPEWALIDTYFAYDWSLNKVRLTDEAGFLYLLDPETFAIEKTEATMPKVDWDAYTLGNSGQFKEGDNIYLDGNPRCIINFQGKKSSGDVSFLFGQWIMDNDPSKTAARDNARNEGLRNALQAAKDSLQIYSAAHREANEEPDYSKWSWDQRNIHEHANEMRRNVEDATREIANKLAYYEKVLANPLLTSDGKSAYILHANIVADTAHSLISRVNLLPDSTWSVTWTTPLVNFYHNASKADQAGVFETVYSKGNPEFDYRWAGTNGNLLVMVGQLRMVCLNLKDGEIAWEIEL